MGLFKDRRRSSETEQGQPDPTAPLAGVRVTATATVVRTRETGVVADRQSVVEVDLMVLLPTGVPVEVTHSIAVTPLHAVRLQPGRQVTVRLDPADPENTLQLAL